VRLVAVVGDAANGPFLATTVDGLRQSPAAALLAGPTVSFDSRAKPSLRDTATAAGDADGVLIIASSLDTAALAQRLRERRPETRLYCASWAVSHELMTNGGAALEGLRTVLPVAMHGPQWPDLAERFRARFGTDPSHVAILHREAVQLVAAAITAAGTDDPAVVKRAIVSGQVLPGAPASVIVTPTGDPQRSLLPHRVVGGVLKADP
jgi:branched-chain amino acid transport system substrate-binding protein